MKQAKDLYRFLEEGHYPFDGGHDVFTRRQVVEPMMQRIDLTGTFLVMLNVEFVISLVYTYNIDPKKITFYSDHSDKSNFVSRMGVKYITKLKDDMIFDAVFINPPFTLCKEFRELGKKHSSRYVWMITKTDHMDDVDQFNDVVYYKHLGGNAFKEQILTCSFLIDKKKKVNDSILIENSKGDQVQQSNIIIPPADNLSDWEYASKIMALGLQSYKAGGGYIGQSKAKKVSTNGIKCIWRCGPVGGQFEWDLVHTQHADKITGIGEHKIIVSKMTSIGNLGDVKYADPTFGVGDTCYRVSLSSKKECLDAIAYLNSPQVRRLLKGIKTMTASSSNKIWSKIPLHTEKDKWFSIT